MANMDHTSRAAFALARARIRRGYRGSGLSLGPDTRGVSNLPAMYDWHRLGHPGGSRFVTGNEASRFVLYRSISLLGAYVLSSYRAARCAPPSA